MKLSGYIQFPVNFCMGKVLISGLELKTGNWSFPEESTIFPCNIFLRFLFFRFELPTGNWNDDLALVQGQLYTTPKFHSNPSYSLWGEEGSTLKKRLLSWDLVWWLSRNSRPFDCPRDLCKSHKIIKRKLKLKIRYSKWCQVKNVIIYVIIHHW